MHGTRMPPSDVEYPQPPSGKFTPCGGLRRGTPRVLFEGEYYTPMGGYPSFDIDPEGDRFLMIKPFPEMNTKNLVYIDNWSEKLKRPERVGPK